MFPICLVWFSCPLLRQFYGDSKPLEIRTRSPDRSFARSLAPLTHSLTSLRSRAPLRSFVRLLALSFAPELVGQWNIFVQFSRSSESLCRGQRTSNSEEISLTPLDAMADAMANAMPDVTRSRSRSHF